MRSLKHYLKMVPGMTSLIAELHSPLERYRLRRMTREQVFTEIFRTNKWGGVSRSGQGSDDAQTRTLRRELPSLLRHLGVTTLLDIPCGDFHWMAQVDLAGIQYVGADIVAALTDQNERTYGTPTRRFLRLDLIADRLPTTDLVLCRDCLDHFSVRDVWAALQNIRASGATYLLATTYPAREGNVDIVTGQWRPLNLEAPPFSLPAPLWTINEENTEAGGAFRDKSLGLWRMRA